MGIWILTASMGIASAQDACSDRMALLNEVELAVQEGRFEDADRDRQGLVAALGCGPAAEIDVLARMWLAEAVILSALGDDEGADDALKAAGRVAPTLWLDVYGPDFQARWFAAQAEEIVPGRLRMQPTPEGHVTLVDGNEITLPALIPSGLHVAQVGSDPETMLFAKEIFLLPDQDLVVRTGLGRPAPPIGPDPTEKKSPALLIVGGVAAAGAATTALLAFNQKDDIATGTDPAAVVSAYRRQVAFGGTSYALMGITAVAVGVHIAL